MQIVRYVISITRSSKIEVITKMNAREKFSIEQLRKSNIPKIQQQ